MQLRSELRPQLRVKPVQHRHPAQEPGTSVPSRGKTPGMSTVDLPGASKEPPCLFRLIGMVSPVPKRQPIAIDEATVRAQPQVEIPVVRPTEVRVATADGSHGCGPHQGLARRPNAVLPQQLVADPSVGSVRRRPPVRTLQTEAL